MLDIKEKPGAISKALMRHYFEGAITNTPSLKSNTPLGAVLVNGEFSHYADSDTDTMWLGFALGMRCAERVEVAKVKLAADHETSGQYRSRAEPDAEEGPSTEEQGMRG